MKNWVEKNEKMNEKDLYVAYLSWLSHYKSQSADTAVRPYLTSELAAGKNDWLKSARQALMISTGQMAKNMKVSRAAYSKYEQSEELGSISIHTLQRAADAMGCELIYSIRPKKKILFSQIIWEILLPPSLPKLPRIFAKSRYAQSRALAAIARDKMLSPQFRREQGWAQNKSKD